MTDDEEGSTHLIECSPRRRRRSSAHQEKNRQRKQMNLMGQYLAPRKNSTGGYDPSIPVWLLRSGRGTRFEIAAFKNSRKASDQRRIVHLFNADSKQQYGRRDNMRNLLCRRKRMKMCTKLWSTWWKRRDVKYPWRTSASVTECIEECEACPSYYCKICAEAVTNRSDDKQEKA